DLPGLRCASGRTHAAPPDATARRAVVLLQHGNPGVGRQRRCGTALVSTRVAPTLRAAAPPPADGTQLVRRTAHRLVQQLYEFAARRVGERRARETVTFDQGSSRLGRIDAILEFE